jgi:ATP-binding cassette subfamily B protein
LLRTNVFDRGLDRSDDHAVRPCSGDAVNRLRQDVDYLTGFVAEWPLVFIGLVEGAVAFVVLAYVNALTTVVVVVPVVLIFVVTALARQRIERLRRDSRESAGSLSGLIGTMFGTVETIKVANAEPRVMKRFDNVNSARAALTIRSSAK